MIFKNINSTSSFGKLNEFLKKNYRVSISESSTPEQLIALRESSQARLAELKYLHSGNRMQNAEYAKHTLIVEASTSLLSRVLDVKRKSKYDQIVNVLSEYVVESFDLGVPLKESLDNVITIAQKAKVSYPAYDLYARVLSQLKEDDASGEFYRKKKEPLPQNIWNLVSPAQKHAASQQLKAMGSKSDDWDLVPMDDDDKLKGFIDPSIVASNSPDKAANAKAQKAASMIKPNSILNKARLEMKESTVNKVRMLVENEVEQAEVISAARNFGRQLQNMVEKIGRLQNEDLGPVIDQMRLAFGNNTAMSFNDIVNGQLQVILDQLKTAREEIDVVVTDVAVKNQIADGNDMDGELGSDLDAGTDGLGGMNDEMSDIDDMHGDITVDDEFGGDPAAAGAEDPLGRLKKESVQNIRNRIVETQRKLRALKESKTKK